jgi:hypothetical protein
MIGCIIPKCPGLGFVVGLPVIINQMNDVYDLVFLLFRLRRTDAGAFTGSYHQNGNTAKK